MNNTYSLESFISFCDDMMIAEEKLDFRILDMNMDSSITLFHGSAQKLSIIRPTTINAGNRLTPIRSSSFWTNNINYAILWALDHFVMKLGITEYCHDINNALGNLYYFVLPDLVFVTEMKDGTQKEEDAIDVIKTELNKNPIFVYQATIPTKYVGRGQCAIDEYTVDIPIKPQKIYTIDFDIASKYIKVIKDNDLFDKLMSKDSFSKDKLSLREKTVFRTPSKMRKQRNAAYSLSH